MYFIDFETRNTVDDLRKVGAYKYAENSTVLMAAVARDDEEPLLWVNPQFGPSEPGAEKLLREALLAKDSPLVAHNAEFERAHINKLPFPMAVSDERWICTAAMSRRAGLHPSLEGICEDLKLPQGKYAEGKALIRKYSNEDTPPEPESWAKFCSYCKQDVRAERAVFKALRPFVPTGLSKIAWGLTLRMNQRGVPVNVKALRNAQALVDAEMAKLSKRFVELTGVNPTQREAVKEWLMWRGIQLDNMQGDTLGAIQTDDAEAQEVITLYRKLSFAAVKKIPTMLACACKDNRVRGALLFNGAGTGRWSGRLIQPQNFRKPTIPNTEELYRDLERGIDAEAVEFVYGDLLEAIASAIRHFIDAGGPLYDADFSAVEARILNWLAGQDDMVAAFRAGRDVYKDMASVIYLKPTEEIAKNERQLGKAAILGAGYGMGFSKFQATCESWGIPISEALAERTIQMYRQKHDKVVKFWYACDKAAKNAVLNPGAVYEVRGIRFKTQEVAGIQYLLIQLPSKRPLAYPHPKVDGNGDLSYYGQLPGKALWGRIKLYGGKIVENIVQAIGADLMALGALHAEEAGFEPFLVVHDQALAPKKGDLKAFEKALTLLPVWAEGLPLAAEAQEVPFYTK